MRTRTRTMKISVQPGPKYDRDKTTVVTLILKFAIVKHTVSREEFKT